MSKDKTSKQRKRRLSMRAKLSLGLAAIAVTLLISSAISVTEYSRMSSYVSDLIADDLDGISLARKLSDASSLYNMEILGKVGDETSIGLPDFDSESFVRQCDSLRGELRTGQIRPLVDSVLYSFSGYMMTSLELENILESDFIDSRSWYFERLQPRYSRLGDDIDKLSQAIYRDLEENSVNFDRGFYRSIIPGIVAVGVGLLLILMLLFFVTSGYVRPVYKMLDGLKAYRNNDKKYTYTFDGDDQLAELNELVGELAEENRQLRHRLLNNRRTQQNS